jgi:hypothetical protein
MKNEDEIIALEREAQKKGGAVAEINGRKVCCRVKYQHRGSNRIAVAYFELDGKRAKRAEVYDAIAA